MKVYVVNEYECAGWQVVEVVSNKAMSFGYTCLVSRLDENLFRVQVLDLSEGKVQKVKCEPFLE